MLSHHISGSWCWPSRGSSTVAMIRIPTCGLSIWPQCLCFNEESFKTERILLAWKPHMFTFPYSVYWKRGIKTSPFSRKGDINYTSWVKVKVAQSCLTLCNTMDYAVHGTLQVGILEWLAIPFSRGSSQLRDWTQVSHIAGEFFTSWATR